MRHKYKYLIQVLGFFIFCHFMNSCDLINPDQVIQPSDVIEMEVIWNENKIIYANSKDQLQINARLIIPPKQPKEVTFRTNFGQFANTGIEMLSSNNQVATVKSGVDSTGIATVFLISDSVPRENVKISATVEGYTDIVEVSFSEIPDPIQLQTLSGERQIPADNKSTINLIAILNDNINNEESVTFKTQKGSFLDLYNGMLGSNNLSYTVGIVNNTYPPKGPHLARLKKK